MIIQSAAAGEPSIGIIFTALMGAIPILGIMAWTAVKIFGPVGQAFAQRLSGDSASPLLEQRVDQLSEELDQVRAQLAETHERLDFAERLLAQGRTPDQLPASLGDE
jgi:hypothetical protein